MSFGLSSFCICVPGLVVLLTDACLHRSQPHNDLLGCRDCSGKGIRGFADYCISTGMGKTAIWKREHILFTKSYKR